MNAQDRTPTLADRIVLVDFGFSMPKLTAVDQNATKKALAEAGISKRNKAKVVKELWAEEDIKPLKRLRDEARSFHYRYTLPWIKNGPAALPCAYGGEVVFETYARKMREYRAQWEALVEGFIKDIRFRRERAINELAGMGNERDYPSDDELRGQFEFRCNILPMPTLNDFRVDIARELAEEGNRTIEQQVLAGALEKVREDIIKYVSRLANVASQTKVFDSVVTNITDLVECLPALNLTDDPRIEAIRKELASFTTDVSLHPDDLKGGSPVAQDVSKKAQKVLDKMNDFFG